MRLASKTVTLWVTGFLLISAPLVAGPVLHEKFNPDPAEDMRLGATTPSGTLPAAIQTKSGVVGAPDEAQAARPDAGSAPYGGSRTPTSADANYYIDRLTTRPDRVEYDEPFRPSVLPFKRLYAFDRIKPDLSFGVLDEELISVTVGGLAEETEDAFFADFEVDLVPGVPVRIPSVGPGSRIRALHLDPPLPFELLEDGAENWFLRASQGGRARMVMQLSIERQVFGSQFRPVSWSALRPFLPPVPESVVGVAREVAAHIGVDRQASPAGVLTSLVSYFRKFKESAELPTSTESVDLYRELSFSQKGVCRHRAYAFAVTAIALGLPTRLVHNEAHAWVEVYDTELWHRIDLGGAATNITETRPDVLSPDHRPPLDPFTWPSESRPAFSEAQPQSAQPDFASPNPASDPLAGEQDSSPGSERDSWPGASESTRVEEGDPSSENGRRAEPEVSLILGEARLLRGHPLAVRGRATREGKGCSLARVDISVAEGDSWVAIGSVATDRNGAFSGQVTLPQVTPVGPLQVSARIAGGCE